MPSETTQCPKKPRYFVDARCGCIAVRDRTLTDPEYQGLHEDTMGVVKFWMGKAAEVGWYVSAQDVAEAEALCTKLNATADPLPPPPTRDGDKVGPAMEEVSNYDDDRGRTRYWDADGTTELAYGTPRELAVQVRQLRDERDAWKARAQAAEKVIATLPKTADGVPVTLGMYVWGPRGAQEPYPYLIQNVGGIGSEEEAFDYSWALSVVLQRDPLVYSTRAEAAEAAKEGRVQS